MADSVPVSIRLDADLVERLDEKRGKREWSRSHYVSRAIEWFIEADEQLDHLIPPPPSGVRPEPAPPKIVNAVDGPRKAKSSHNPPVNFVMIDGTHVAVTLRSAAGRWSWSGGGSNGSASSKREAQADAKAQLEAVLGGVEIEWVEK